MSTNGTFPVKKEEPTNGGSWFDCCRNGSSRYSGLSLVFLVVCSGRLSFTAWRTCLHDGGVIIAANHQTYIDPFWLSVPIKRPTRYLAWSAAFRWPIVGSVWCGLARGRWRSKAAIRVPIRRSLQWLRDGGAVVIFPEGGRSTATGSLERFKAGAVRLALEAQVPILPVTIKGGNRVWPRGWRFPRLGKVVVTYHPLYHAEQCSERRNPRLRPPRK